MEKHELRLECNHHELDKLHQFLRNAVLDILGDQATEDLISAVILAVHEAFTNVVRHAYADRSKGEILLRCMPKRAGIGIELIDDGMDFNPFEESGSFPSRIIDTLENIDDWNELEENQLLGGYGIPIIQAAATYSEYWRSESGHNHLYIYFENEKQEEHRMSVLQKTMDNVTVVQPPHATLDTRTVSAFRDAMQPVLSEKGDVVLDMSNVTFVDSAGLGALLSAMKQITGIGGSLRLAGLNEEVLTLFRLVRMNRVFEIFGTVEEAIADQNPL